MDTNITRIRATYPILRYLFNAVFVAMVYYIICVNCAHAQTVLISDHETRKINENTLFVIVNRNDDLSRKIAEYYLQRRHIARNHVIEISLDQRKTVLDVDEFKKQYTRVRESAGDSVNAFLLTWAQPYQVGCMSITSAFAFGYDEAFCSKKTCSVTRSNPYYAARDNTPLRQNNIIPTMMLASENLDDAMAIIDRGVSADDSWPQGKAYLLETTDENRSVRKRVYSDVKNRLSSLLPVDIVKSEGVANKSDILFYFTGSVRVPYLNSVHFLPGAIADHLTSFGGRLTNSTQMSAMRWLESGATGSYGTVVEPCNLVAKFPDPRVAMYYYLKGETLIEAYWKSVLMPGEGVFIGEPLSRPFGGYHLDENEQGLLLRTHALMPGTYRVQVSESVLGPFTQTRLLLRANDKQVEYRLPKLPQNVIKLDRIGR